MRQGRARHRPSMRSHETPCRPHAAVPAARPGGDGPASGAVWLLRGCPGCEDGRTMRGLRAVGGLLAVGAAASFAFGTAAASGTSGSQVVALRLDGVVDPFEADYVTSGIRDAVD